MPHEFYAEIISVFIYVVCTIYSALGSPLCSLIFELWLPNPPRWRSYSSLELDNQHIISILCWWSLDVSVYYLKFRGCSVRLLSFFFHSNLFGELSIIEITSFKPIRLAISDVEFIMLLILAFNYVWKNHARLYVYRNSKFRQIAWPWIDWKKKSKWKE